MPDEKVSSQKLTLDISDLKKNIAEANRQIKLANAQFKATAATMDDWTKSADGLSAKIAQTKKVIESQKTILASYEKELENIVATTGEESAQAQNMRIKIEEQKAKVAESEKALKNYTTQLDALNKETQKSTNSVKSQATAYDNLEKEIEDQEKDLDSLKKAYAATVLEQGKDSKQAQALAKDIQALSTDLATNKSKIKDAETAADSLGKELDETEKQAKETSDGFTIMKGVLSNLVTQGINLAVNGFKKLASSAKDAYKEFDTGRDTVIKVTGATGEAAKTITKNYKNVAKTVNASMSDVGKAVGEVSTKFGLSGEKLEKTSELFLKFANINDTDVTTSIDKAQKAMSSYGLKVDDTAAFLDALTAASQNTGANVEKLEDGLVSNATAFQEMGLSVEQAVNLMGQLEMSGVNSETALNGMRKALKNSAKDGVSINTALSNLQKTIDDSKKSTDGLNAAYEVFGKSGDQIYGAIKNGTLNFNELAKASTNSAGAVEATFAETQSAADRLALRLKAVKVDLGSYVNEILTKYEPQITKVIEQITPKVEQIGEKVKIFFNYVKNNEKTVTKAVKAVGAAFITWKVASLISSLVKALKAFNLATKAAAVAQAVFNAAMNANPIGLVVTAIAGLVAAFVTLWNKSEAFRNFWIELWESIKGVAQPIIENTVSAFQTAWDVIKVVIEAIKTGFSALWATISPIVDNIVGAFQEAWGVVKVIIDYIQPYIEGIFNTLVPLVVGYFKTAWDAIKLVWNAVSGYFTAIWESIKTIFSFVVTVLPGFFKNAWEAIKLVWKAVTGYFENIWNTIKNIFSVVKNVLSGDFKGAWEAIKNIFSGWGKYFEDLWDGVKNVFKGVKGWFGGVFEEAWKAIKGVFDTWGSFFSGLWDTISSTFSDIGTNIGDAISGSVKAGINGILSTLESVVNKAIGLINGVMDVINDIPGVDIGNIDKISLPRLEKGGVLKKGQVGLLEGNGAEAVVPLDQNKKWIASVTKEMKKSLSGSGASGGGAVVKNYTFNQTNNSPKALSRLEIYRQTRNQLSFSKGGV